MDNKFPEVTTGYNSGGYPLLYVGDGIVLCGNCASKEDKELQKTLKQQPHMEGSPIECDECGKQVESAYGDPDED